MQLLDYKVGQKDYKVGQIFGITKWGKLGLQSGAAFGLQSGAKRLQSGAGITKWGKGITKWGRDYKVGQGLQSGAVQIVVPMQCEQCSRYHRYGMMLLYVQVQDL